MILLFQPAGDPAHEMLCVVPIVAAEPLASHGSLEISSGILVGLGTANQKCADISFWCIWHMAFGQKPAQMQMAQSSHAQPPTLDVFLLIYFSMEKL